MKFTCAKCRNEFPMSQARSVELPADNTTKYCGNCYWLLVALVSAWIKGELA